MKRAHAARASSTGQEASKKAKFSTAAPAAPAAPSAAPEPRGFILKRQNDALVANFRATQRALRERESALAALRAESERKNVLAAAVDRAWHQLTASLETIIAEVGAGGSGAASGDVDASVARLLGQYGDGTVGASEEEKAEAEAAIAEEEEEEEEDQPDPSAVEFQSMLDARREAAERLLRAVLAARGGGEGEVDAAAAGAARQRARSTARIVRLTARLAAARAAIATLESQVAERKRAERDADRAWAQTEGAVDAAIRGDAGAARSGAPSATLASTGGGAPSDVGPGALSRAASEELSKEVAAMLRRATTAEAERDALSPAARASNARLVEIEQLRREKSAVESELATLRMRPEAALDEARVASCAPFLEQQEELRALRAQLAHAGAEAGAEAKRLVDRVAEKAAEVAALRAALAGLKQKLAASASSYVEKRSAARRALDAAKAEVSAAQADAGEARAAEASAKSFASANARFVEQVRSSSVLFSFALFFCLLIYSCSLASSSSSRSRSRK